MTKLEKRQCFRTVAAWPATMITPQGFQEGETVDISPDGAFVSCPKPLQPGEKLSLILKSPNNYQFQYSAQVVWSCTPRQNDEKMPRGMGIMFIF
jgi:PilZ domain